MLERRLWKGTVGWSEEEKGKVRVCGGGEKRGRHVLEKTKEEKGEKDKERREGRRRVRDEVGKRGVRGWEEEGRKMMVTRGGKKKEGRKERRRVDTGGRRM